jgi:hypothetical protein
VEVELVLEALIILDQVELVVAVMENEAALGLQ